MTPEEIKQLANISKNLPIDEIYRDILSPSFKKAGNALGTLIEFGTIPLLPLKLLSSKARYYFEKNISRYEKKLEHEKSEPVIQVPEYIGLPILDKLTYLNDDYLCELFTNLLCTASFESKIGLAHPKFISILNDLSSDEAKLLQYLNKKDMIPTIDILINLKEKQISKPESISKSMYDATMKLIDNFEVGEKIISASNLTGLEFEVDLVFPNIHFYIENLEFLGLIKIERNKSYADNSSQYKILKHRYSGIIKNTDDACQEIIEKVGDNYKCETIIEEGYFEFTTIGKQFLKACIR